MAKDKPFSHARANQRLKAESKKPHQRSPIELSADGSSEESVAKNTSSMAKGNKRRREDVVKNAPSTVWIAVAKKKKNDDKDEDISESTNETERGSADTGSRDLEVFEESSSGEEETREAKHGKAKTKDELKGKGKVSEGMRKKPAHPEELLPTDADYVMSASRRSRPFKINLCCKSNIMTNIMKNLGEELAKIFRETCFGSLLNFSVKKTSSQLLLHLIQRQCNSKKYPELTFKIGGKFLTFGIREFCLMTGLNCGTNMKMKRESIKGEGKLKHEYFEDVEVVRRLMLNMAFKVNKKAPKEDMLKMSLLYCLESFLLPKQDKVAIEDDHILMVDDLDMFNAYPWGRVAYKLLVSNIRNAGVAKGNCTMGMGGLVYALLAWAYEVIPKLSSAPHYYATRTGNVLPRMLNWDSEAQPEWRELLTDIFEGPSLEVRTLVASDAELTMPYFAPFLAKELAARERNNPPGGARPAALSFFPDSTSTSPIGMDVERRLEKIEKSQEEMNSQLSKIVVALNDIAKYIKVVYETNVDTEAGPSMHSTERPQDPEDGEKDVTETSACMADDHTMHKAAHHKDKDDDGGPTGGPTGGHGPSSCKAMRPTSQTVSPSEQDGTKPNGKSAKKEPVDDVDATVDNVICTINERTTINRVRAEERRAKFPKINDKFSTSGDPEMISSVAMAGQYGMRGGNWANPPADLPKAFIKLENYSHPMPTRYILDADVKDVVTINSMQSKDKVTAAKETKKRFEERVEIGKNMWF